MTVSNAGLTVERVRSLLAYDSERGHLYWLANRRGGASAGDRFGKQCKNGYRLGKVDQKHLYEHRLIWFIVHGEWPPQTIDHVNRIRDDNRLSNLRLATYSQNNANRDQDRSDGRRGVTWHKKCGKWQSSIQIEGKFRHLGLFSSIEEAGAARDAAARAFYGEFAFFKEPKP